MAENCKEGSKEGSKTHRQTRLHRHRDLAKKRFKIHRPKKSILLRKMDERECGIEEKQISVSFKCMAFVSVSDILFTTNAALGKINLMTCF